jgi:hypothetical protein
MKRALQRRAKQRETGATGEAANAAAEGGVRGAGAPLPHLDTIQSAFGHHDVRGVQAFSDGAASRASERLGAEAYALGDRVAFAGAPSLHTAAHEAAHVVQQRAGVFLKGGVGQADDAYERHADRVADRVVQGGSAAALLDEMAPAAGGRPAVQRLAKPGAKPEGEGDAPAASEPIGNATAKLPGVNVRAAPSLKSAAVGRLKKGQSVEVTARAGAFLEVRYEGQKAFVRDDPKYVDFVESAPPQGEEKPVEEQAAEAAQGPDAEGGGGEAEKPQVAAPPIGAGDPDAEKPAQKGASYKNQRDNKYKGAIGNAKNVNADIECNITTLAMQLVTMAGGSDEAVNQKTIELLKKHGGSAKDEDVKKQPEDLILQFFELLGDAFWAKEEHQPYKGWYASAKNNAMGWHQQSWCRRFVANMYTDIVDKDETKHFGEKNSKITPATFKEKFGPALEAGGTVELGTKLTSSGHIIMLVGVKDDGILVHDPYGLNCGGAGLYIRNQQGEGKGDNKKRAEFFTKYEDKIKSRLRYNSELLGIAADKDKRTGSVPNWGENNFYTWAEAEALSIGLGKGHADLLMKK